MAKKLEVQICTKCKKTKLLHLFNNSKVTEDGKTYYCKKCTNNAFTDTVHTKKGVLAKIYSAQRSGSKKRGHVLPNYTLEELRTWAFDQQIFHTLYDAWVESKYQKPLVPSFDRLDDYKPYSLNNIQIMTWQENNDKFTADEKSGINTKRSKCVLQYSLDDVFIAEHHSAASAARSLGKGRGAGGHITNCCKGKWEQIYKFKWKFKLCTQEK